MSKVTAPQRTIFDQGHYLKLIEARGETIRRMVAELKPALSLSTALDAGCGVGFFAKILYDAGLQVRAFDGRTKNVEQARERFPGISFEVQDVENRDVRKLGPSDLVLCFGLLYHLESPLAAIRNLHALTGKCLLLESMSFPSAEPWMLLREEPNSEDQSLTDVAFYSTEGGLVKMLYRAGFVAVYRIADLPDHDDFRETAEHDRRRTVLLATRKTLALPGLTSMKEPLEEGDPWAKQIPNANALTRRARSFLSQPSRAKYFAIARRVRRIFPRMPIPLRLPFGAWWIAKSSALDNELLTNGFETAELCLVGKLLRPGMIVLDVGAHHGLYSLLMAKRIGQKGRAIAFEPSSRERVRLLRHLRLNGCSNVRVESCALGNESGEAELFLTDGIHDWCNSLKTLPGEARRTEHVSVRTLDDVLLEHGISHVDFIKLDVEGAELSFLGGASRTLTASPRPAILAEVQDIRTQPWGYAAREIIQFLLRLNYQWFGFSADGFLTSVSTDLSSYDANLVALPAERVKEFHQVFEPE